MRGWMAALAAGALAMIMAGPALADDPAWRLVAVDGDASFSVIDSAGLTRDGDLAHATLAVIYAEPQKADFGAFAFMIITDEYDCAAMTERPLAVEFRDAEGKTLARLDTLDVKPQAGDGSDNRSLDVKAGCEPATLGGPLDTPDLTALRTAFLRTRKGQAV